MATSGSFENVFKGTTSGGYALRVAWEITSQSVADNTSTVNFKCYLVSYGERWHITSTAKKYVELNIGDESFYKTEKGLAQLDSYEVKEIYSVTITTRHNVDGTKTLPVSCRFDIEAKLSGEWVDTVYCPASGSQNVVLERIGRATTPTITGTMNVGNTVTINLSRYENTFVHTLEYSTDNNNFTQIATNVGESYSWTLPAALATARPNSTTGNVYIRSTTYTASLGGTNIGSKTITVAYTITSAYAAPSLALTATSTDAIGSNNFIRGISTVTLTATATMQYSATPVKYVFTYGSTTQTVISTSTSATVTYTLPTTASASYSVSCTVTDSRGYTASAQASKTTYDYTQPQITTLTYERGNIVDGVFVEDNRGKVIHILSTGLITDVASNAKKYKVEYRLTSAISYTTLVTATDLSSYSYSIDYTSGEVMEEDTSYVFRVSIIDSFNTLAQILDVSTQKVFLNFSSNGRAMCFGGIAETNDVITVAMPQYPTGGFKAMTIASSTDLNDLKTANHYTGNATSGSLVNCPISGGSFALFVDSAGSSNQVIQRLTPASASGYKAYLRVYSGSAWSDWMAVEGTPILSISSDLSGQIEAANGLLIQWGMAYIVPSAENTVTTRSISFEHDFDVKPSVTVSLISAHPNLVTVGCSDIDTDSVNISVTRANLNPVMVSWIAVGKGA